ncbi:hypothetical protein A3A76_03980 [Candidatus Woesebacteria bacterium RIFCSPLOWO2_01_FULL_39_23]|uniref:ATP synthase F0 subunit B n=1 Tax=Candidatus Woesebacteria bacterium RIFCSPHIGHO2_01_FULL_40_22 TaxID=1802499 RepID=A0A1F7YK10_9BACT|nr:MAG: hypothetical protein A2141_00025 [Candidatus Woesebacteria bacterium RBG_16_40_11]OGM27612.1 MAG: hypothetical protein A2628_02380 [Candidatus Woesebacteria bacterium RIFCSPHIGHO2_01_FULL_40_22]OGM36765.1 MAG: hypothetical protein A3E41_03230 [Candidatus Woesebacteria bacterium RIFCSPHIGHO2_12_FULL_38_9]OGM62786.1 MAG: hypothetical protein A3A76_03980 [Candidatus Woesebacteria bacterium RIFCSPLOWO2_01_FULL_39_23]
MEKLGIDPLLIAVQIINFVLLLIILRKVLYKPILTTMANRQKELAEIEKKSVEVDRALSDLKKREKEILTNAQNEKRDLILAAKRDAEAERKKILDKANNQAKEILSGTRAQIERDKKAK